MHRIMAKSGIGFGILLLLVVLVIPVQGDRFVMHVVTLLFINVILALALHIFFGVCGQITFGITAFYGIGAYGTALLQLYAGLDFFIALVVDLLGVAVIGLIVSVPLLRLRHWVLALGTFGFAMTVYSTFRSVGIDVMGGDNGFSVPKLMLFGKAAGPIFYYYFIFLCMLLCFLVCERISASRVGRAMKAIREEEVAAANTGINVTHYVRLAFLISSLIGGLAGGLYASWGGWISPEPFGLHGSLMPVVYVVAGGLGRSSGAIVGAVLFTLLPEFLFPLQHWVFLIYAAIFFLILRFMPAGVVGTILAWKSRFLQAPK